MGSALYEQLNSWAMVRVIPRSACYIEVRLLHRHSLSKCNSSMREDTQPSVLNYAVSTPHRLGMWNFTDTVTTDWSKHYACLFAMPKPGEGPFSVIGKSYVIELFQFNLFPNLSQPSVLKASGKLVGCTFEDRDRLRRTEQLTGVLMEQLTGVTGLKVCWETSSFHRSWMLPLQIAFMHLSLW